MKLLATVLSAAALTLSVPALAHSDGHKHEHEHKHEHSHEHNHSAEGQKMENGQAGKILTATGHGVFKNNVAEVVRVIKPAGDKIKSHNHPGEEIFFTVLKGKVKVYLNEKEVHEVPAGETLQFNGKNYISADILEDATIMVVLVKE